MSSETLTIKPGIYWRGVRITNNVGHVEIMPGHYVIPFSQDFVLVTKGATVKSMRMNAGVSTRRLDFLWGFVPTWPFQQLTSKATS